MSRVYRNKKNYIEALKAVLAAKEAFKDLEIHKHPTTQEEFLFLTDIVGHVFMFDITGMKNEDIFHIMAMVECGQKPECFITDNERKYELGKLFN